MPDLITHTAVPYLLKDRLKTNDMLPIFFIGALLPDILTRIPGAVIPQFYWFYHNWHSPFLLIFFCYFMSLFFKENRRKVFYTLYIGTWIHMLLDLFQKSISGGGYHLFFPFSWYDFQFNLIWPGDTLYLIPLWLILAGFRYRSDQKKFVQP